MRKDRKSLGMAEKYVPIFCGRPRLRKSEVKIRLSLIKAGNDFDGFWRSWIVRARGVNQPRASAGSLAWNLLHR